MELDIWNWTYETKKEPTWKDKLEAIYRLEISYYSKMSNP
jgi:hypothetical protein